MTQGPVSSPVQIGQILAGKYRVERILGVGGMGVVVAALHVALDERVAIKFLLPEALENEDTVARFSREARAAVKIKSEHVARVSDVGALEHGAPYMVMEYLEGSDLSELLEQRGPLPVDDVVDYVLQASEAIAEAHSLGIVHRDLKPSNLFLSRRADGSALVKVLDFGISKVTRTSMNDAQLTRTTAVMGSPLYMAPEQMVSTREVDARADIWALGVVIYQLVAGHAPFLGETMTELCARILQEQPAPIRMTRPDVSPAFEAVILQCLEKHRDRRFSTMAELALALAPFAPQQSRSSVDRIVRLLGAPQTHRSHPIPVAFQATAVPAPPPMHYAPPQMMPQRPSMPGQVVTGGSTASSWGSTQSQGGSGTRVALIGAIAAIAIVAGALVGLLVVMSNRGTKETPTAATTRVVTPQTPTTAEPDEPLPDLKPQATQTAPHATVGSPTAKTTHTAPFVMPSITAPALTMPPPATTTAPPPATTTPTPTATQKPKPDIF